MGLIYHLADPKIWERALSGGAYAAASLATEGFIHCSTKEQLIPSATKHFTDANELVVLEIPEKKVRHLLKMEPAQNGELFPHIYGKIRFDYVENTRMLFRNKAGEWEWD
ncbi:MAG: DUF952 domain-containing protein [Bacteroidota bacterium]